MLINRRNMILTSTAALIGGAMGQSLAVGLEKRDDDASITALINKIRREHGVQPLVLHNQLRHVAQLQSDQMAKTGKLKHSVGFGNGFRSRMHRVGIYAMAAENIAAGQRDAAAVFAAWMRSEGHRHNMLDPDFAYYGLARATSEKKPAYPYWTLILSL